MSEQQQISISMARDLVRSSTGLDISEYHIQRAKKHGHISRVSGNEIRMEDLADLELYAKILACGFSTPYFSMIQNGTLPENVRQAMIQRAEALMNCAHEMMEKLKENGK